MRLIEDLKQQQADEPSYFRQHLMMEDISRLERLAELAATSDDLAAFVTAGKTVGWTPEDRRTHELNATLEPLLVALHGRCGLDAGSPQASELDDRIEMLWQAFDANRMERLIGCLSRVPPPQDAS
ncbi:MAG: hypothetical protein KJ587_04665 [Alphaproteobacteria bacterium]|nr:hypothetical protein [Alphaproteobacteria bacterium]